MNFNFFSKLCYYSAFAFVLIFGCLSGFGLVEFEPSKIMSIAFTLAAIGVPGSVSKWIDKFLGEDKK